MAHKGRHSFSSVARSLAISTVVLLWAVPSWAEGRALSVEASQEAGYGRIIASWADGDEVGPVIRARMTGPVLVLDFDQEVEFDLDALKEGLPSYVAIARMSEDGREARIALAREYRIHTSKSFDLTAIDLVTEDMTKDPADIVSPLKAIKDRQAIKAAEAAEAARIAALPPPLSVQMRASETADFSTLAFYWPEKVGFIKEDTDQGIRIRFDRRGIADFTRIHIDPPNGMIRAEGENTESEFIVDLNMADGYWASAIEVDNSVIVRFHPGSKPDNYSSETVILPAALQTIADSLPPVTEGVEPPSLKPHANSPLTAPATKAGSEDKLLVADAGDDPSDMPKERAASYSSPPVSDVPEVALAEITPPRVWNEALPSSGKVSVKIAAKGRGVTLELGFAKDIPGVVFRRHGAIWLAFPASGEFDLSDVGSRVGMRVDQVSSDSGMALRVFMPDDLLLSLNSGGRKWALEVGNEGRLADRQIKPKRAAGSGGSGIDVEVPSAGTVFRLEDPDVGQELVFIPALDPSTALVQSLSFVDAEFPVTAHGLVVVPRADDLRVMQRGDNFRIGRDDGLALSSWGVETELANGQNLAPGFLDFADWRKGGMDTFWANHAKLSSAAAANDPEDWSGQSALLDLARFFLSWELAAEAYGPLNIAASADALLEQDAQWLTMLGAADVMNGRYESAIKTLDKSSVRSDSAAAAWRGLAEVELGDWRKARESFIQAESMINAHSPEWAGRFHSAASRAMIRMGDGAEAERHALAAKRSGDDIADGQATLTLGELAVASGRLDDARNIFSKLENHKDANTQVRAELGGIKLAVANGDMSDLDASDRLDTLRFRWRGDELELEIVSELVDSYFNLGRYRESLTLAQSFASQFPNLPGARDLRISLSDHFQSLFLDGKADKLDPIASLALFYEFKDLTPIGPDGDRMIRKLANRLVAFDLLDPATELLAHQVDNRNLIGASRAKISADLAAIYLMDNRPEAALQTLNATRQTGLEDDLRLERRLLEAAAHMELQRYGHAIELLQPLEDQSALDLLAEVHWRARTWGAAGRALQRTLPPVGQPLSSAQLQTAVRSAVAYRLDGDMDGLTTLRKDYNEVVSKTDQADTFDLLTGTTQVSTSRLTDTIRQLADTTTADAFVSKLKQRFSGAES